MTYRGFPFFTCHFSRWIETFFSLWCMPRTAQSFPTTGSLEGSRMSYSAPFQRQLASRTTTRGIAVITVAISSLLCSAFLAERIRGPGNRHLILFISAGTCRGHTNVRLCGRHWRMILFHRHARGSDSPSFAVVAMLPTKSSLDDSRCDAAAVSPLSTCPLSWRALCRTASAHRLRHALRLIPRHDDGPNATVRFARIRLAPHNRSRLY